jgi:nitrous-oxide reductase
VYGFDLIKKAIDGKKFEGKDRYGVPILKFDAVVAGKVELGAGPLHTQYDNAGNPYTSLYLESAVVKWTLGAPYHTGDQAFKSLTRSTCTTTSATSRQRRVTRWIPGASTSSP